MEALDKGFELPSQWNEYHNLGCLLGEIPGGSIG
jgi:hypothetical protein